MKQIGIWIWSVFAAISLIFTSVGQAQETASALETNVKVVRLVWADVPNAVLYELEVLDSDNLKQAKVLLRRNDIATPGVELPVSAYAGKLDKTYYHVRAINYERKPISNYTEVMPLSSGEYDPKSPLPTALYEPPRPLPLYVTYAWIPVAGAASYQVEVAKEKALDPLAAAPSRLRTDKVEGGIYFDYYDWSPYNQAGNWYWRVRALNQTGQMIGQWSDPIELTVERGPVQIAVLGDSVTHGGGAVSNPPANPLYDWTTYTGFSMKNLGKSGDTTETMLARFEQDVLPFQPKILLIMGGVNDYRAGRSGEEIIDHLAQIVKKCRDYGIRPILVTPTPVYGPHIRRVFQEPTASNWQDERNKVNAWICAQPDHIDIANLLTDRQGNLRPDYAADGLHPDASAKELMGTEIGRQLEKLIN